ncbi:MAG TPA: PadR family transcriptional regulator [Actinomycetota bacterium]
MGETEGRPRERESDPGLLIMLSLVDGPKHGYAIIEEIERIVGVRLSPGTLYGAIGRLARRGLIEPLPAEDRRQPYRLTARGAEVARDKFTRLANLAGSSLFAYKSVPLPFRPGEQMQDVVWGSYEAPYPLYRPDTTQDETSPDDS